MQLLNCRMLSGRSCSRGLTRKSFRLTSITVAKDASCVPGIRILCRGRSPRRLGQDDPEEEEEADEEEEHNASHNAWQDGSWQDYDDNDDDAEEGEEPRREVVEDAVMLPASIEIHDSSNIQR